MLYKIFHAIFLTHLLLFSKVQADPCPSDTLANVNECISNPCRNSVCVNGYGRYSCYCNENFTALNCLKDVTLHAYTATTCEEYYQQICNEKGPGACFSDFMGHSSLREENGPYLLDTTIEKFRAYCDFSYYQTWTVIQRRSGCEMPFYRNWTEYQRGFGHPSGDYWMGLDRINQLMTKKYTRTALLIEVSDWEGGACSVEYDDFRIGNASDKYRLISLGNLPNKTYLGDCGDSLGYQLGMQFSTYDNDNDMVSYDNCAVKYQAAWWYNACFHSNLNGRYVIGGNTWYGLCWLTDKGFDYSYKTSVMMIRQY